MIFDSEPFFYELDDKETGKVARDPNFFLPDVFFLQWFRCLTCQVVAQQYGEQPAHQADTQVEGKGQMVAALQQRKALVGKCGEGGEPTAETSGQQQQPLSGERAVAGGDAVEQTDEQASCQVGSKGAQGEMLRLRFQPEREEVT